MCIRDRSQDDVDDGVLADVAGSLEAGGLDLEAVNDVMWDLSLIHI